MKKTSKIVIALVTVLLLVLTAACAPAPGEITPAPTPTPEEVTPPPTPEPTPEPEFFLTVTQPADESIINADKVEVRGRTIPNAVVSVNGELAEVDEEGNFTMMVVLEEGPNLIEVIASDFEGNEQGHTLVIIYVPSEMPETGLFLSVTQPADNSIINADKVEVRGRTSPGAVVSVNGELAEVDEEGNFTMMVVLEEGPNLIEVIASDFEGNEQSRTLVIIYVP